MVATVADNVAESFVIGDKIREMDICLIGGDQVSHFCLEFHSGLARALRLRWPLTRCYSPRGQCLSIYAGVHLPYGVKAESSVQKRNTSLRRIGIFLHQCISMR